MIVHCIELGSFWWSRIPRDEFGNAIDEKIAFFNTTGFPRGGSGQKFKCCWDVPGVVRFDAGGFPRATTPKDFRNINIYVPEITERKGATRLFSPCIARRVVGIDRYMVGVRSSRYGEIDFDSQWRTKNMRIVCASSLHHSQETLLLIPPDGAIQTSHGVFNIEWRGNRKSGRRAELVSARNSDDYTSYEKRGSIDGGE